MVMLGPSIYTYFFRLHFAHTILAAATERPTIPTPMPRGREIFLQGQEQGPKESFSLNERRSSFKGRLQKKERRYCLRSAPEANQSVDSTAPLAK